MSREVRPARAKQRARACSPRTSRPAAPPHTRRSIVCARTVRERTAQERTVRERTAQERTDVA